MSLLFIDVNHFIALGTFLDVSETVSFVKVDLVGGKGLSAIVAISELLIVFHIF